MARKIKRKFGSQRKALERTIMIFLNCSKPKITIIRTPKKLFLPRTVAHSVFESWRLFFGIDHDHKTEIPFLESIRAYEAIGYECLACELKPIKRFREVWDEEEKDYETIEEEIEEEEIIEPKENTDDHNK